MGENNFFYVIEKIFVRFKVYLWLIVQFLGNHLYKSIRGF